MPPNTAIHLSRHRMTIFISFASLRPDDLER